MNKHPWEVGPPTHFIKSIRAFLGRDEIRCLRARFCIFEPYQILKVYLLSGQLERAQYSDSETPVEKLNPTSSTDFRYKTLCIIFLGHPVFVKTFVFPAPFGHNYGPLSRQILGQSVVFTAHLPSMSILGQRQTQYYPLRRERKRLK